MKHIVFIIALFFMFLKTFAFDYTYDCTDIGIAGAIFTKNNEITVAVHGPQRVSNPGYAYCCLQQGPEIIGDYTFYTNDPNNPISTVWKDRAWVNGYTQDNVVQINDCLSGTLDCDKAYEGVVDYVRSDTFDASKFPPPGDQTTVTLQMTIYAHCYYNSDYFGKTICLQGCTLNYNLPYNPPPN